ncbi:hypothetical protein J2S62_001856 [Enteractinococcus fodinae]|uniref:Uncharacterized protein n=1 Tax=Enteractinococcus fodinae TaxID=684663 RepID=A0ABU2B3L3_9MICC|nr:hypothetical protein [Enteractinococcus fodinae]
MSGGAPMARPATRWSATDVPDSESLELSQPGGRLAILSIGIAARGSIGELYGSTS